MTLTHLTGAKCDIYVGGTLWAGADFELKLSQGKASHARTGYKSDVNYPGKLTATITCKNVMKNMAYNGMMLTSTPTSGTGSILKSGITLTADGYTATSTSAIATPSRISLTAQTAAVTTPGVVTVIGFGIGGAPLEEDITVGDIGVGASVNGSKLFTSVTGYYNTGVRSATGTLTASSITGAASYVVTANTNGVPQDPAYMTLLMQGFDDLGNYVKAQATNCWISSNTFKSGDSANPLEDAVTFEIMDIDGGLSYWDVTTN